ncbi:MAG TPA: hypothetical protein VEW42_03910 [Candidatus Eisenbacteria bacterium]|nr:hypothetical protein [Candidatus Eisenbacteria bacterium]
MTELPIRTGERYEKNSLINRRDNIRVKPGSIAVVRSVRRNSTEPGDAFVDYRVEGMNLSLPESFFATFFDGPLTERKSSR